MLRDVQPGDYGWVIQRNGELYAEQYGWDQSYEVLVAQIVADFAATAKPERERVWIAEIDGERAGAVFCKEEDETMAKLRLLHVEPFARGHGLGSKLVGACVEFARAAGYESMTLWTQSVLTSAVRIYETHGFELVQSEPHRSFGHELIGQTWSREL